MLSPGVAVTSRAMVLVESPRLWLVPITDQVVRTRLVSDRFEAPMDVAGDSIAVRFGPEWPGDALGFFLHLRDGFARGEPYPHQFVVVEKATREAVAMVGAVGALSCDGDVEIGYGTNASRCGQGFATEAVEALCGHLLSQDRVRRVTARTRVDNPASARVLQRTGFAEVGRRVEVREGEVVLWARDRPDSQSLR